MPGTGCQTDPVLRVLGSLELDDASAPRSAAQRVILSALVLDLGRVVSSDRLADLVWADELPADPPGALQSHVSRLRRLLPDGAELVAEGTGYLLRVPDDGIDVVRFEAGYRAATAATDDTERLRAAAAALALWRGLPYPDLDDTGAAGERARLGELRGALIELEAEALVRSGRAVEAVAHLEVLRADQPLRERTVELLMRAHVAAGRKTDALDAYRALREALVDEKGLDPSPELRELERAILTEELVAEAPAAVPEPAAPRSQVAVPVSAFVGRDQEVASLADLLAASRIVTLVGPGGIGKTRLATHAAAAVAEVVDDVDVVELASLRSGDRLAESVATALGIQPRAGVTATQRVVDAVGSRARLIVLDNCEHVVDDAAAFVDDVVRATPRAVFLATSREPLNVDAETVVRVEPLPTDGAAVELFAERAAGMGRPIELDGERARVEVICRALDGLPLALELAAAQLGSMTVEELADAVERPLDLLGRGRRTADDRHRSLRELVEWSVRDLPPNLLDVFTVCAAFAGPFTTEAVASVADLPRAKAAAALADLVDRSLVARDTSTGAVARFAMLETIRAYAAELLAAADRSAAVTARHGDWALELVDGISSDLERWADAESARLVAVHLPDLRVAHQRFLAAGDEERALRLAASLHYEAYYGMHGELLGWITETAERFGSGGHPVAESVLASAAIAAWQTGDLTAAADWAERAAAAVHPGTPGAGLGAAEAAADLARFTDDHETSRRRYQAAVERARDEGNVPRSITNLADGAMIAGYDGEVDAAHAAITEARGLLGDSGPLAVRAWLDYAEGEAVADHDPGRAIPLLERAVDLAEQSGAAFIIGVTRLTASSLQVRFGDAGAAVPGLVALIEHWRARGARLQQWITLRSVVELFVRLGELGDAAAVLGAVDGSGTAADAAGADADRLMQARETILAELPDAPQVLTTWAAADQDLIVDRILDRLRAVTSP